MKVPKILIGHLRRLFTVQIQIEECKNDFQKQELKKNRTAVLEQIEDAELFLHNMANILEVQYWPIHKSSRKEMKPIGKSKEEREAMEALDMEELKKIRDEKSES